MKSAAALAVLALAWSLPASAASLCNCCATGTAQACSTVCESQKPAAGQCIAVVDFAGKAEIGPGKNPLYTGSLKNLVVSNATGGMLEDLRRVLEASRTSAEADRKAALRDFAAGKMNANAAAALARRYDKAMVNYFLGMHAYRAALKE